MDSGRTWGLLLTPWTGVRSRPQHPEPLQNKPSAPQDTTSRSHSPDTVLTRGPSASFWPKGSTEGHLRAPLRN